MFEYFVLCYIHIHTYNILAATPLYSVFGSRVSTRLLGAKLATELNWTKLTDCQWPFESDCLEIAVCSWPFRSSRRIKMRRNARVIGRRVVSRSSLGPGSWPLKSFTFASRTLTYALESHFSFSLSLRFLLRVFSFGNWHVVWRASDSTAANSYSYLYLPAPTLLGSIIFPYLIDCFRFT